MVKVNNEFKKTIELAEHERVGLLEKLKDYEKTRMRIAQLETFISTGKSLYNIDTIEQTKNETTSPKASMPEVHEANSGTLAIEKPLDIAVAEILSGFTHGLKLSEIEKEFRKRKWKLSEKNGKQVLRSLLLRRQDLFKEDRVSNVLYFTLQKI